MKRRPRRHVDLRLKIAIIQSRLTQRRMAVDTRIGESRLSEIVGRRMSPPTPDEMEKIARYLDKPIADLFPMDDEIETERAS